ncbi:type 11 methyltransferase [Psychromonas sp. CNPT3]|uniref:class I SAM-dependent methyltransferase n=1 Tax=Psychromonas sp. CNPT3 TaxID=314282 RepID=UPI00006E5686|nr:class I SAM-dependent methyltransferase [Psychromonas sp. CNPT3]AGH80852.1 type 11 methyltransferase [Psychromonas sp. CNPT3]
MSEWDSVAENVDFNLEISADHFARTVSQEAKVLDFGCGYGRIANQLYHLGYRHLVGVDSSIKMIHRGLIEFPHLDLRHLSGSILPFADNEFDSIITCAVFTCIPNQDVRKNILIELRRVLKPNGVLYLAEFCSEQSMRFTSSAGVPMWHSQQRELKIILDGFNIEQSQVVESSTMSGHASHASHIFARKII